MAQSEQRMRVKVLRNTATSSSIMVRRPVNQDELQIATWCYQHPKKNIVRILQTPREDCIKMKHYSRGDLDYYLRSGAPFTIRAAKRFFRDILKAVVHLHKHEIAHRNLCLKNIYLTKEKKCVVGNFGCALTDGWKCSGQVGSRSFIAPEMFIEAAYDGLAADMWSLGVLLFVLFTGLPPFHAAIQIDLRFQKLARNGIRPLISAWNLHIPSAACDLLDGLLCIDPDSRITAKQALHHPFFCQNS